MRVLIIGTVSGNGGDAAILLAQKAAIEAAAAPGSVHVDVLDYNPDIARGVVPGLDRVMPFELRASAPSTTRHSRPVRVVLRATRRASQLMVAAWPSRAKDRTPRAQPLPLPREDALRIISEADVCLYTGGTTLVETYGLHSKLGHLRACLLMGKPLVLGTQSLGPFTRADYIEPMRVITAGARAVLLREERSLDHLRLIGADISRAELLPDIVFALAPEVPPVRRPAPVRNLRVTVSVRPWTHFARSSPREGQRRYATAIQELVTWLVTEKAASVTFLSTCQGLPGYWLDDSKTAVAIADGLPAEIRSSVTVRRDHCSPTELLQEYGESDLVIATRMHAAILALSARTPVIGIAYEFKTAELFQSLGLPELAVDIESVSGDSLVSAVENWHGRHGQVQATIERSVADWRLAAGKLGQVVVDAATPG